MTTETLVLTAAESATFADAFGFSDGEVLLGAAFGTIVPTALTAGHVSEILDRQDSNNFILLIAGDLSATVYETVTITDSESDSVTFNFADADFQTVTHEDVLYSSWFWTNELPLFADGSTYHLEFVTPEVNYNCDCDDATGYETLSQLRTRLMVRLGYAGQVGNPPPGMAALLNDFLTSSQRLLYMKYAELRTERFFTWTMEPGVRLYDLPDNDEVCTKQLNALKLTWVGVEDLNGAFLPLISGIPPEFYTGVSQQSLPQRYEIRQCIEVFPAPDAAYKLRIKAHFKLQSFTGDSDQTTIDSELVFLWALATAKAHYGQPDANNIAAMANDYLGRLVGGKHGTKRYVPGAAEIPAVVRPTMVGGFDA